MWSDNAPSNILKHKMHTCIEKLYTRALDTRNSKFTLHEWINQVKLINFVTARINFIQPLNTEPIHLLKLLTWAQLICSSNSK